MTSLGSLLTRAAQRLEEAGVEEDEARPEARLLLARLLGTDIRGLLTRLQESAAPGLPADLEPLLQRRFRREPLAYILGDLEFYGLDFTVAPSVLIPRPETETLIDVALGLIGKDVSITIADIGTGSGCIAVALAVHLPNALLYATDSSPEALALAQANAQRHDVQKRITFLLGDLVTPLPGPVDILVSNPPYIPTAEIPGLQPEVRCYEPHGALDGGPDGLDTIRRLLSSALSRLKPGATVLVEIGAGQGEAALALARTCFPQGKHRLHPDLGGHLRVLEVRLAA
ncbi:MAG: peptide chain release factor N(5)-glutamine methyltransferase [Chloroflexi bacterium]|nr:peptide chain release factor N(5)-glutamine methyltransferase [Chloroflexota bacterium]